MKLLLAILFLIVSVNLFAQDVDVQPEVVYYHDTLTTTIDTIDVDFVKLAYDDKSEIQEYTLSIYTNTGADSVKIFTLSKDDLIWCQQSTYDILADTSGEFIIVSTTPKEYSISDSDPNRIRIISLSNDSSTTLFTIQGKK